MVTPINLNKARKAKARAEKERRAAENRIKHGQPKAVRSVSKLKNSKLNKDLDGKKLDS